MPSQRTKPKQIKWIVTCVCLNGHSKLNTQYFYMEIVRFESQEYTLQDKLWILHKTSKVSLENPVKGSFRHDEFVFLEKIIEFALRS